MADKADDIRQEIKKGRQDIADTRSAITEKLGILEDRVQETVDGVKHAFDLHYQVKQRPWLMFGGSVLVGYVLGPRGGGSSATSDTPSEPFAHAQPQQSIVSEVRNQVKNDLATIKGAAFGAVISTLWAMAKQVLPLPARQIDGAGLGDSGSKTNGRHDP
ncbi:MAG: hypothetical protein Q8P23_02790 [bacterium]|nr:hypothetical protein [bacterium]MDZ4343897.1 hypothetical protein [Candidatus Binatia bacterium]